MASTSFRSVPEMFLKRVSDTPDHEAFSSSDNNGGWKPMTWREVGETVRNLAGGLRALGLQDEERVSILSNTRVEWILADLGILCAAGATTTIYPSNTAEECAYIINDSDTRYAIAENNDQVKKLLGVRDQMPNLRGIVTIDGTAAADGFVLSWAELLSKGKAWNAANPGEYERVAQAVGPQHLATLIYTSGTTGMPKGVELTHDSWIFEGEAMDALGIMSPSDKQFLFLPLAHSFGKVLEVAIIRIGIPTAIDGRMDKIVQHIGETKPTFVAAVPRVFEKAYNKIIANAKEGGAAKWAIFKWAIATGREASALRQKGQEPGGLLALKLKLADKLVYSKVRDRFGGRLKFFISGSAPLSREIAEFFHAVGILILEGYGLTETSAASYVNRPDAFKFGSVGFPLPGVEIKLDPADGEILLRGRGILRGYHNLPDATAEVLTPDGWLRTGDIGEIDADGYLKITDRKKDLIKTSGGKYVAPQELENRLKTMSALISQVVVHGNARNFCSALVTIEIDAATKFVEAAGGGKKEYAELTASPEIKAELQRVFDELNKTLPSYSTLKKFAVLPRDFSIETGELTPSMKVKRKAVEKMYKDTLDGFYAGSLQDV